MPAAVVRGIILSLGIIAALGLAVYENPEVQRWVDEQRRKIAELLRGIGEELDPQSRRTAEAFAFEGRTPTADDISRVRAESINDTASVATGRKVDHASTVRRIPIHGTVDAIEMERRQKLGKEYLERRNQQMAELQGRRKSSTKESETEIPSSPTSFDAMVDDEGKLKLPDAPVHDPASEVSSISKSLEVPESIQHHSMEVEANLEQAISAPIASSSRGLSGLIAGSNLANPFSDEYSMDRSETPKPPVPPKIQLEHVPPQPIEEATQLPTQTAPLQPSPVRSFPVPGSMPQEEDDLTYEEQLAIALSLSEQDSSAPSATVRRQSQTQHDAELRAAIAASLREMDSQQAAHAVAHDGSASRHGLLIDIEAEDPPTSVPQLDLHESEEDLYNVTPNLTRASLATLNAQQPPLPPTARLLPYDPVHEAARISQQAPHEASFYSAQEDSLTAPSTHTLQRQLSTQATDAAMEEHPRSGAQTPTAASSYAFQSESAGSETFASVSAHESRTAAQSDPPIAIPDSSRSLSESSVEVADVLDDSDVDMMSEDGIITPDSWTEVGSRDGESEDEAREATTTL